MVARSHIERDARALLGLPEPRRVAGVAVAWGPASWPTSRRARELYFNAVKLVAIELDNERTAGEIEETVRELRDGIPPSESDSGESIPGLRDLLADMRAACQTVCAGR